MSAGRSNLNTTIMFTGLNSAAESDSETAHFTLCSLLQMHELINCLSSAMHGQNINLPVCVSVSVTLSVNSPTGQTPQRIFTADSLKDADFLKDVPFGGLDDE